MITNIVNIIYLHMPVAFTMNNLLVFVSHNLLRVWKTKSSFRSFVHPFRAVAKTLRASSYNSARGNHRLFSRRVRKTFIRLLYVSPRCSSVIWIVEKYKEEKPSMTLEFMHLRIANCFAVQNTSSVTCETSTHVCRKFLSRLSSKWPNVMRENKNGIFQSRTRDAIVA